MCLQKNHWFMIFITYFSILKKVWPYIIFITLQFEGYMIITLIIILLTLLFFSFLRWINTKIVITNSDLIYREGTFFKNEIIIPIQNISLIELERNWFYKILKLRKFKVDNLSSSKGNQIYMILKVKELNYLYNNLSFRIKNIISKDSLNINKYLGYKISAMHLILLSMLRSNIILGIGVLISFINLIGKINKQIQGEIKQILIDFLTENIDLKGTYLAILLSILFVITILLLVVLVFSILATLIKYYKFIIFRKKNYLRVEYGLFNRKNYSIPTENIHALKVEQNILCQIFNLYTIKCSVVGYGDEVKEDEVIFPMCGEDLLNDILIHIIPEFYFQGSIYRTDKKNIMRFFNMPVFIASLISVIAFLYSNDLILVSIIIPIVVLNRFLVLKNNEVGVSDTLFYISYKGFGRTKLYIRKSSTEEIWSIANPFQRRKNICNIKFKYYSQKRQDIKSVKNLDSSIYNLLKNSFVLEKFN